MGDAELKRIVKGNSTKNHELDFLQSKPISSNAVIYPLFKQSTMLTPKVCPDCLNEDGIHQEYWLNVFEVSCRKHNVNLVTVCGDCSHPLAWEPALLAGVCTNAICNKQLDSVACNQSLSKNEVADCLLASRIIRLHSEALIRTTHYPAIVELHQAVECGLQFLSEATQASKWVMSLHEQNKQLPITWRLSKRDLLLKHITCAWPSLEELSRTNELTSTATIDMKNITQHIVPAKTAASLLQTTIEGLHQLDQHQIIHTIGNNRLSASTLVDISYAITFLMDNMPQKQGICISSCAPLLMYCDVTLVDLLVGVKMGKLNINYRPKLNLLDSLFCDEIDLKNFCEAHFTSIREDIVTVDRAMRLTNAPRKELMKLRKKGRFRPPLHSRTGNENYVMFEDVLSARKQFQRQAEFNF
jgi:hypothetical protein